ncbi:MAG: hypothetical protein WBE92_05405 [Steroidobacteraceae bacterium]
MQKLAVRSLVIILAIGMMTGCVVRAVEAVGYKADVDKLKSQVEASEQQCKDDMQTSELDPIRSKVELHRTMGVVDNDKLRGNDPPPFAIASNEAVPTDSERTVIARWASMRDICVQREDAIRVTPAWGTPEEKIDFPQQMSIATDLSAHVGELILLLYQQKLTYGQFAQKQYEFDRDALASELALTKAIVDRDDDERAQAQKQFAAVVKAWTDYIQTVNARQPKTVNAHTVP